MGQQRTRGQKAIGGRSTRRSPRAQSSSSSKRRRGRQKRKTPELNSDMAAAAASSIAAGARNGQHSSSSPPHSPDSIYEDNDEQGSQENCSAGMMEEEDDDMYAPSATLPGMEESYGDGTASATVKTEDKMEQDEEEEDDDDEEDDSDDDEFTIITQRKPGETADPPERNARPNAAVKIEAPSSQSTTAVGAGAASTTPAPSSGTPLSVPGGPTTASQPIGRVASPAPGRPGSTYPEVKTSTLDLDANPVLGATGRPVYSTDMDADFAGDSAPWRRPGTDMSDYYNYGFDEGTWAAYCLKQRQIRGETAEDRKRMEQLQAMMGGSMPFMGMGGAAGGGGGGGGAGGGGAAGVAAAAAAAAAPPGMDSMTPEQAQMMMQMMGGMGGMPGMDAAMGQGAQPGGFQNQGYGGGRNQGGRGKRW